MGTQGAFKAAVLVFASMVSSTLLIPAVRPFFAAFHAGSEGAMHAFMSLNMLGAALGAPFLAARADRVGGRRRAVVVLAVLDGVLLLVCALPALPVAALLAVRTLQGAVNVGALSILMGVLSRAGAGRAGGGSVGLLGGAVIAAVAAGTPLGVVLLAVDPALPLWVGAACALGVAPLAWAWMPVAEPPRVAGVSPVALLRQHPLLRIPAVWMAAERFTVGCFVVTYALHAHHVLQLDDAAVGRHYSFFLIPFAALVWPGSRLTARFGPGVPMVASAAVYGLVFVVLGFAPADLVPVVLLLAGVSSAVLYAGALQLGASQAQPGTRSTAMGLLNAGGTLGMMAGTALSGVLSAALRGAGWPRHQAYAAVFVVAGAVWVLVLAWSAGRLLRLRGAAASATLDEPVAVTQGGGL